MLQWDELTSDPRLPTSVQTCRILCWMPEISKTTGRNDRKIISAELLFCAPIDLVTG